MFGKIRKLGAAAVLVVGLTAPSVASADTATPPLSAGDVQVYASLTPGGSRIVAPTARVFSGSVTSTPVGSTFTVSCNITVSIIFNVDGTTRIPAFSATNCVSNVPNCDIAEAATAGSLVPNGWGNRLVRDSAGVFRDRISMAFTKTLSNTVAGACPAPSGGYPYAGVLSPRLTGGGAGIANAMFDGAVAGTVTSPLGPVTSAGGLVLESGQPAIYFVP